MKKREGIFLLVIVLVIVLLGSFVSAKPPIITEFIGDRNLVIEANVLEYYKINEGASIFIHVFNKSDGVMLDNTTVNCNVELTDHNGTLILDGVPTFNNHHWIMTRDASVVTERGQYAVLIHCNSSSTDGYKTFFFQANGFGEGLEVAHSIKFNMAMGFLLIFFILLVIGIFGIENVVGKWTCYMFAHLLFIGGTFCMWQFNQGYTTQFLGMSGIWKVVFYVSTSALLPVIILTIAMMIIVFAQSKEIQGLIDRGSTEEDAMERVGRKRR